MKTKKSHVAGNFVLMYDFIHECTQATDEDGSYFAGKAREVLDKITASFEEHDADCVVESYEHDRLQMEHGGIL